jgi:hypothetical protein
MLPYLGPEIIDCIIGGWIHDRTLSKKAGFRLVFEMEAKYEDDRRHVMTKIQTTLRVVPLDWEGNEHVAR